jgi:HK97 gp10 family phage protein
MSVSGSVSSADLSKVLKNLREFPQKVERRALSKAGRAATKLIAARAKELAPMQDKPKRGQKLRSPRGRLKKSIKVRAMKRKKGRVGFRVTTGQGDFKGDTFYGGMVEYGTTRQPAQPFMRPAWDEKKQEALATYTSEVKREIDLAGTHAG